MRPAGRVSFTQRSLAGSPVFCIVIWYTIVSFEWTSVLIDDFVRLITGPLKATSAEAIFVGQENPFSSV